MRYLTDSLLLFLAGGLGTLLRAGCNTLLIRLLGNGFPWGTLAVNLIGSFVFGAIYGLVSSRALLSKEVETILLVGLLGGFTTYSSFAFQSTEMLITGRPLLAAAYVATTVTAGILAVWAGLRLCS
jgi:CrcB protein